MFSLGVTILLSLTVFLNLVAETLPQVSDAIPLLGENRFDSIFLQLFLLSNDNGVIRICVRCIDAEMQRRSEKIGNIFENLNI